jgi:signal transduction histidine kinase
MPIPRSANIKIVLLIGAVLIALGTLLYTQHIVRQLLEKEHDVADLYAKSLQFVATSSAQTDYSFVFDEVIRSIDFPMILSDEQNKPLPPYRTSSRNIDLDTTFSFENQNEYLVKMIAVLDQQNPPIKVTLKFAPQDSIIQYVHYGESALVTKIRWLPFIEIAIASLFIVIGYIGFSYIKRNEQSNIWIGMSKETAHQLGTPLSSLMGWIEMLKTYASNEPKQEATIAEMENDLRRLQKVTERFSKIGSKPSMKEENLNEVIESVIKYFHRRLPSRFAEGRNIEIKIEPTEQLTARINRELFEWVIENLIKNALDAIEDRSGTISFSLTKKGNNVLVDVKDTGKGIDMKYKKDIFRPGYSTKQRGWGLGLSLSKRIIETHHKGKLFVKESKLGKGTTFRIKLVK